MLLERNIDDYYDEFLDSDRGERLFESIQAAMKEAFAAGFVAANKKEQ